MAQSMIRKAAVQMALPALLIFMAFNAYLAIRHLMLIQKSAELTRESSVIQANIAAVSQDLTDMETGQRGYLLSGDDAYLQPYTEAKGRVGNHFASLRSEIANRAEQERTAEAQLESLTGSKQTEMERTISLRQQGYRHRAFQLVNTNEGRDYMDRARALVSSLSAMESSSFARFDKERSDSLRNALSGSIIANLGLLVLTTCVFWLTRYHERGLEREAALNERTLAARDSQIEKLTSALANQTRIKIRVIEENARLLLEKYGSFLPRQGCEYAEQIKEAAAEMERLRRDLVGGPVADLEEKAA
jgi:CHASE3 domain sensor protein